MERTHSAVTTVVTSHPIEVPTPVPGYLPPTPGRASDAHLVAARRHAPGCGPPARTTEGERHGTGSRHRGHRPAVPPLRDRQRPHRPAVDRGPVDRGPGVPTGEPLHDTPVSDRRGPGPRPRLGRGRLTGAGCGQPAGSGRAGSAATVLRHRACDATPQHRTAWCRWSAWWRHAAPSPPSPCKLVGGPSGAGSRVTQWTSESPGPPPPSS